MGRMIAVVVAVVCALSGTAWAEEPDAASPPSQREIQRSVEAYLAGADGDARLVGSPGDAGYDDSFWIRAGAFTFRTGMSFDARYEAFDWEDHENEAAPGGDLSGFSLPRVTWWCGGEAPCGIAFYGELEFGHATTPVSTILGPPAGEMDRAGILYAGGEDLPVLREGWIGWQFWRGLKAYVVATALRDAWVGGVLAGIVPTAGPRQLMTPPEEQQFVDASLGAAWIGDLMPGWTDRNRDIGVRWNFPEFQSARSALRAFATMTNGDGPDVRNVLDALTDDHIAFSARVDWMYFGRYVAEHGINLRSLWTEAPLDAHQGEFTGGLGAWGYVLHDAHRNDRWLVGLDANFKWGGLTMTGGYQWANFDGSDIEEGYDGSSWYVQAGYLFPNTPWEVVARSSGYDDSRSWSAIEYGVGANFYLDGTRNRFSVDVTRIEAREDGNFFHAIYPGYQATGDGDATMFRFSWKFNF